MKVDAELLGMFFVVITWDSSVFEYEDGNRDIFLFVSNVGQL